MNEELTGYQRITAILQHNARMLGARDIVVSAYPGSGASLISNILLELGFDHLDPYTVVLHDDGATNIEQDWVPFRRRLAATAARDDAVAAGTAIEGDRYRFVKNHMYPQFFDASAVCGAVLLIRDPRDAIHSSYQFFHTFTSWLPHAPWDKGQGTFEEFLDGRGINDDPPIEGWIRFYRRWIDVAERFKRFAVVRFEDLKADAAGTTATMLESLGIATPADLATAAQRSSFESMRAHEDELAAAERHANARRARIVRRGKVGEWREWYGSGNFASRFGHPDLVSTAAYFGYDVERAA